MPTNDLAALSEAATQGEWLVNQCSFDNYAYTISAPASDGQYSHVVADVCLRDPAKANAAFIVALVNRFRSGDLVLIDREGMRASKVSELAWAAEMLCRGVKFECSLGVASATETGLCCDHCDQTNTQCYQIGRVKTALKPFLFADTAIAAILGEG